MNDYQKMTRILTHLCENARNQPSLEELAGIAGLSPFHFQRKFVSWVGISPKAFLQCLTLENARSILQQSKSIMDVALDSGLSGPARLHDLCIKLDAATPGEIKSGGKGLKIDYGIGPSPFGECLLALSARGICYLAFIDRVNPETVVGDLISLWPAAELNPDNVKIQKTIKTIFSPAGAGKKTTLNAYVRGSRFQVQVWRALLKIPEGRLISYGGLAQKIKQPDAARAVGNAVAANPIAYLIPCHRVIRNSGVIGNYRWGSRRKKALITYEAARCPNP
jgi:AraC family transcriptional regulator of adaptative response/methylated-DNA-[protein]-cysteine methyltransferase